MYEEPAETGTVCACQVVNEATSWIISIQVCCETSSVSWYLFVHVYSYYMEKTRLVADYSQVHNKGGGGVKLNGGASRILKNY